MKDWILVGLLLSFMGLSGYLYSDNKKLQANVITITLQKDQEVEKAQNEVWKGQKEIETTKGDLELAIKNNQAYAVKIDSLSKANGFKISRLEQALMISARWIDSTKKAATLGEFKLINPRDSNKVNPLGSIPVTQQDKCWGMKGEIITRDPNSKFNVLQENTITELQLVVIKGRKFLFWVTKLPRYEAYNDCGEPVLLNVKMK